MPEMPFPVNYFWGMIHDPVLGLIFIKTLKVSGSSFEAALAPLLSAKALVTINENWMSEGKKIDAIECRRTTWLPSRHLALQALRHPREALNIPMDVLRRRGPRHEAFSVEKDHISAEQIRAHVGEAEWDRCLKVEIARNPYERLVSYYFMKKMQSPRPDRFVSFREWIVTNPEIVLKNERLVSLVDEDGHSRPAIDFVLYYEDMDVGLRSLARLLDLDEDLLVARYRSTRIHDGYRPKDATGSVEHVIDDESKVLIDTLKSMRFDRLGYERSMARIIPMHMSHHVQGVPTARSAAS